MSVYVAMDTVGPAVHAAIGSAACPGGCREFLSLRVLGALVHSVCGRGHPGRPLRGGLAEAYCGPVYSRIPGPHKLRMRFERFIGPASWT